MDGKEDMFLSRLEDLAIKRVTTEYLRHLIDLMRLMLLNKCCLLTIMCKSKRLKPWFAYIHQTRKDY